MFSTVLFSVVLVSSDAQFTPFSLKTSFCGSMNTTAVSLLWNCMPRGLRPLDRCRVTFAIQQAVDQLSRDVKIVVKLVVRREVTGVEDIVAPLRMTQIDGPGKDSSFGKPRLGVAP